jgi:signal transduction histidine kinase
MSEPFKLIKSEFNRDYLIVILLFIAGISFDFSIALGVAGGVPYILPVLFTLNIPSKKITYLTVLIGVSLTVLGLFLSPEGGEFWKVLINRTLAIFAILSVGIVIIVIKNKNAELMLQTENLIRASQTKSKFLSAMNHEFRTPLNIITGFSKMLKMSGSLNKDDRKSIDYIDESAETLLKMVKAAISFADLQEGEVLPEKKMFKLTNLIDTLIEKNNGAAKQKNITLVRQEASTNENSIEIVSDPTLLGQAVQIILENAILYNYEDGKVFITLEKTKENSIRLSVSDTGYGISEDRHFEVFNPFSRLNMRNSNKMGLGLGLTKAKLICDILLIDVDYKHKAVGTLFWLDIPLG